MRAWIISDIHFSPIWALWRTALKVPDADVCICAGDVADDISTSVAFIRRHIEPYMPVVMVLGNHDFYSSSIDHTFERARDLVKGTDIHLLENQCARLGPIRFIGATLWTDFAVEVGGDEHLSPEERRAKAFELIPYQMADYIRIFRSDERLDGENGTLTVREILNRHIVSRRYIDQELEKPFDGRSVVVTHHAPLTESLDSRFFGYSTNAAFGSDLSDLVARRKPSIWVHGHIHRGRDYLAGDTRILCNPRGYGGEWEVNGFRPNLVIEL